jgi:YebC/PmpR family DNA-binding regulatory protein
MARHSKWAKVKNFKGAIDAKRGKMFAKLSKEIFVAAKMGGADPDLNPRLRAAMLKARQSSVPADNIDRAVKRATGEGDTTVYEDLVYEIYGPGGVALLVDLSTDNRNRTAAELRSICAKNGGTIAAAGAVSRLFHRQGQIIVARESAQEDALMEIALEAGAEDLKADEHGYEILTEPAQFEAVHKKIEAAGIPCEVAEVTSLPTLTVPLTDPTLVQSYQTLHDLLEEHDDVKELYSNAELPE